MATHAPSIFRSLRPDTSGNVVVESLTVKAVNDLWLGYIWIWKDTATDDSVYFRFRVPENYVSTPKLVASLLSAATSGNFVIEGALRAIADAESLDPSTWQETVTGAATAVPGTALLLKDFTLAFTGSTFAAGDKVLGRLTRKGTSVSETLAADLGLIELAFVYDDV